MATTTKISLGEARRLWLRAQRLDDAEPFGTGPAAVAQATEHLGYVQIDTINVIERCHHHILWSRIPKYRRRYLETAQSTDQSVFEFWAHALAYIPTRDYRFFVPAMNAMRQGSSVDREEYEAMLARIRNEGALSLRDFDDDVLVEKDHPWASRKPSKRLLSYGFYSGDLTICARSGMLKTYELADRHFGWSERPAPATADEFSEYLLDRGLRSQGLITLESATYGDAPFKGRVAKLVEDRAARGALLPVEVEGASRLRFWADPKAMDELSSLDPARRVLILSPFDPLVIQRKRLAALFGYEHRFEAYVPANKRVLGYFALPVIAGDKVVAAIDAKMDRASDSLMIQKWTWIARESKAMRGKIETALGRFERFQKNA